MAVYPILQIKNKKHAHVFSILIRRSHKKYDCQITEAEPESGYFKTMNSLQGRSQEETTTEVNTRSVVRNQPYEIF